MEKGWQSYLKFILKWRTKNDPGYNWEVIFINTVAVKNEAGDILYFSLLTKLTEREGWQLIINGSADYFLDQSINCLVYNRSENSSPRHPKAQGDIFKCLVLFGQPSKV